MNPISPIIFEVFSNKPYIHIMFLTEKRRSWKKSYDFSNERKKHDGRRSKTSER